MEGRHQEQAAPPSGCRIGSSSGKEAKKTVKMSESCDVIPYEADAGAAFASEPSQEADTADAPCEPMQDTPDYIRRGAPRYRIAPVELFSAPSPQEVSREAQPDAGEGIQIMNVGEMQEAAACDSVEGKCHCCSKLKDAYDLLLREHEKNTRLLEDLRKENECKSKECHEAQASLHELKMELMRKSMHVGSLAFAVEGQVKEKSRWCQALKDLSAKFKLLKLEHQGLLQESREYRKCMIDATNMTRAIQQAMNRYTSLESEFKDLKQQFVEEAMERKDLYNKLIELKGNIRVFCRCRPLNEEEIAEGASMAIDIESAKDGELIVRGHVSSKKVFRFDSVFSPDEDQEKVFEKTAPFATSVLDGYNVCIFAYGQTGTGKTFTMEGTEGARGINYRTLEELFRIIKERQGLLQYEITVSVLEVYNEQIHDLLLTGSQPGVTTKRLEVRQVAEGVHHVPGLVEARVSNMNEAWEVLQTGSKARVVGSTNANEHSSRSHCIHCVMVRGENLMNGECTKSKLWLIDLAGSERVAKTDAQGDRLKEAQNINKSLSALGDVISALATKSQHIPFRNSKLTHLLQDSLSMAFSLWRRLYKLVLQVLELMYKSNAGGDSKTLMFVQISPNENDVGETLCSLNFASRVRGIELGQARKQVDIGELSRYKLMVGRAKQDSKSKDAQIKSMEETIQSLEMKNKAKDLLTVNLQEKIKELESQLLVERKIARQHVDNKIAQDHLQQQQQQSVKEENSHLRSPMSVKNQNSTSEKPTAPKDFGSPKQLFADSNTSNYSFKQLLSAREKENNPEVGEQLLLANARRVSLCNPIYQHPTKAGSRRNSMMPLPRRNSLVPPLPTVRPAAAAPPLDKITEYSSPPICSPPVVSNYKGSHSKKISSILRRSLQKKVIIRPAMLQSGRRGGAAAQGTDSAHRTRRVPLNGAGQRVQHQHQRDKERGWNNGTSIRHNF